MQQKRRTIERQIQFEYGGEGEFGGVVW